MIKAQVEIPQMFTAYAQSMGRTHSGLHKVQYFCEQCDQSFASAWGALPNSLGMYERGARFHCPFCGFKHEKHVANVRQQEKAPHKIRLTLKASKNVVVLEATCETAYFEDLFSLYARKYKEVFRFDIAKQTATFSRQQGKGGVETFELGNPFKIEVLTDSILGWFVPNSLANTNQKTELTNLLKLLREEVHTRLEKRLGHRVSSMHVSHGQQYGLFLLPLYNIAYRLTFPDAHNLPAPYREAPRLIKSYWDLYMIDQFEYIQQVMEHTWQGVDFITALTTVSGLPNKTTVRRILQKNPFEVSRLVVAFKLCSNYDYAIRLHAGLQVIASKSYQSNDIINFLKSMCSIYGETGIVQMVEKEGRGEMQLADCMSLYRQLNAENKQAIKDENVKINELHDWMARRHRRQNHVNLEFNVPQHIINRLTMQKDRLNFFLPKESTELLDAGASLHNCVASYGKAMRDNSKWIVLVADDRGKLAACLEVRGRELVQAKLDCNKSVANDPKLNAEVLAWANEANIEIKTNDIKRASDERQAEAV